MTDAASPSRAGDAAASLGADAGIIAPPCGAQAEDALFADAPLATTERAAKCPLSMAAHDRVVCLLELRFAEDAAAAKVALELYNRFGILAGTDTDHVMNGGYRGMLHLVPAPPVGADRRHIAWVLAASNDFEAFFSGLEQRGASAVHYRWHPITLRYMRSVNARTPSAYALDWDIAYNLSGSLHVSADAVRETMFHEIFHLNDGAHHEWSITALGLVFDSIVRKCGVVTACLTPFSPNSTMVKNGTYYSFQPGNGVREYAAELAVRYFREHRAILRKETPLARFKCGPSSNARAWELFAQEFFGGFDLVPACGDGGAAALTK